MTDREDQAAELRRLQARVFGRPTSSPDAERDRAALEALQNSLEAQDAAAAPATAASAAASSADDRVASPGDAGQDAPAPEPTASGPRRFGRPAAVALAVTGIVAVAAIAFGAGTLVGAPDSGARDADATGPALLPEFELAQTDEDILTPEQLRSGDGSPDLEPTSVRFVASVEGSNFYLAQTTDTEPGVCLVQTSTSDGATRGAACAGAWSPESSYFETSLSSAVRLGVGDGSGYPGVAEIPLSESVTLYRR